MEEVINLAEIRKQNSEKLEFLLSNPDEINKLAKEQYGKNWKVVYAGQRHYHNSQIERKWNEK